MKTVAIIGHTGLIGSALNDGAIERGIEVIGIARSAAPPNIKHDVFRDGMPDVGEVDAVFLCAALPNVDLCEQQPDASRIANLEGPMRVAEWCAARAIPLVFYSTDYVFDGEAGPYDELAQTNPINVYGRHKLEAEKAIAAILGEQHLILRVTVVFGVEAARKNFAIALHDRLRAGQSMRVPSDQIGTPVWSRDVADASLTLLERKASGVVHVPGATLMSRAAFAREAARTFGLDETLITDVQTADLGQAARRPLQGGLVSIRLESLLGRKMLTASEGLARFAAELRMRD